MTSDQQPITIDYEAVLADLRARRAALDASIAGIEQMLGLPASGIPSGGSSKPPELSIIEKDTFFGLSIVEAARKYLLMKKRPQNTKDIVQALETGGLTHTSKNFVNTVFSVLKRQERQVGDIIRVKRDWGLAEWYPGYKRGKGVNKNTHAEEETESSETESES